MVKEGEYPLNDDSLNVANNSSMMNDKLILNNLCGGTSNLVDFKTDHSNEKQNLAETLLNQAGSSNSNNLYHCEKSIYENTEKLSGFEYEFHQLCKKIDRVKENFITHRKFMDIVKS